MRKPLGRHGPWRIVRATDWTLLAVCGVLLVAGPAMALQELLRHQASSGLAELTGTAPELDPAFRATWRGVLLLCVIAGGVVGTLVALRCARQAKVRALSGRLLTLLLVGMTLLDLAFLADGRWFLDAPYAVRGATVVWLYPAAAILMGGALVRLTEIEAAFGEARAR